ncbi:MAG: biotin carboxylase N-terminal domain-containing protein, partial [Caldimonas sp.]
MLIANRGEIAVRVNRSCRDLGIETVQVYSEADRDSLAVRLADLAVCIGGARSSESYLDKARLVQAAKAFKADAVHPGYGFLSENPEFAALCVREGLTWIGPGADVIRLMGNKAAARKAAADAGLSTTPGSPGAVADWQEAAKVAETIGFPLILKASAGGGGRGMRLVTEGAGLKDAFSQAQKEAQAAFGDGTLYVERFLTRVRHVEVQVLGDAVTMLHLGERDCSTQRRNQKLVEESPGAVLSEELRADMCGAAAKLAASVGYTSAGTIEFIVDPEAQKYYFMEMNTRIQVEHPVTEMVTGIDLV